MVTLKGKQLFLRALEPEDIDFLYKLENDETIWQVSETQTPYSRYVLKQYLKNSYKDIYVVKQLRLAIVSHTHGLVGLIDLYDFDPKHKRAGVGIVVDTVHHSKGIGTEALELLCEFAFTHLQVHQLFAHITPDNNPSIRLFTRVGFLHTGTRKEWLFQNGTFMDELIFQKIAP